MNVWDFVNSINHTKVDLFEDPQAEKEYNPFIINRALSNFPDTLFFVNEMNSRTHLDKKLQFDFLKESISKKKRYSKWNKKETITEDIEAICSYYKYSKSRAFEVVNLLTPEQVAHIKQEMNKGGKS